MKKTKKGNALRIVLMCLFGLTFLFSAYKLVGIFTEYKTGSDEYDQLRFDVVTENIVPENRPEDGVVTFYPEVTQEEAQVEMGERAPISVDFETLLKVNPDVVGWIYAPGTPINYPVVQGEDNEYYLTRDFYKNKSASGTLFLDENHPFRENAQNLLLHGHNMKDGTMFGRLAQYLYDDTYLRNHPFVYFDTLWHKEQYVIFAAEE